MATIQWMRTSDQALKSEKLGSYMFVVDCEDCFLNWPVSEADSWELLAPMETARLTGLKRAAGLRLERRRAEEGARDL